MPDGCRLYSDCVPRDVIVACSSSGMSAALCIARQSFVSASNHAFFRYIFLDEDLSLLHFIRFQVLASLPRRSITNALSGHFYAALHGRDGAVCHCIRAVERQRVEHRHVC